MPLRIIFMGTPDFAVPCLSELIGAGHEVAAVYTQPPRAAGRGQQMRLSPVHVFAQDAGLHVETPATLKDAAALEKFTHLSADVAVVVAYGLILPKTILDVPEYGCLNLHASLLPRWRGAAPIQRAIMAGDTGTGVMVMRMDEGLDTGNICLAERVSIGADETSGELHDALKRIGADLMVRALAAQTRGSLDCTAQGQEGVTYASKIEKSEARIDWDRPALEVHNHIRGLSPFPGAWFELEKKRRVERVKVLRSTLSVGEGQSGEALDDHLTIACGSGAVHLTHLQRAGKKPMTAEEFQHGMKLRKSVSLT